jgi:hypothetical protein
MATSKKKDDNNEVSSEEVVKPKTGGIKKKEILLSDIKDKFSTKTKYKEIEFYNCGEAFYDACGIPGPVLGGINMLLGHSNAGKTTAMILAAVSTQKRGHLPVFIITEKKWSFEHAKLMGFECEEVLDEETGEIDWDGFFIFNNNFDYIEQIEEKDYICTLNNLNISYFTKATMAYFLKFLNFFKINKVFISPTIKFLKRNVAS